MYGRAMVRVGADGCLDTQHVQVIGHSVCMLSGNMASGNMNNHDISSNMTQIPSREDKAYNIGIIDNNVNMLQIDLVNERDSSCDICDFFHNMDPQIPTSSDAAGELLEDMIMANKYMEDVGVDRFMEQYMY